MSNFTQELYFNYTGIFGQTVINISFYQFSDIESVIIIGKKDITMQDPGQVLNLECSIQSPAHAN